MHSNTATLDFKILTSNLTLKPITSESLGGEPLASVFLKLPEGSNMQSELEVSLM